MKVLKLIIAVTLLISCYSCNGWLSLNPSNQIDEDQLFETGLGYRNALNGIYQSMAQNGMYGQEMTWGTLDVLAQYYDPSYLVETWKSIANDYAYENDDIKSIIDNIWSTTYNSIANANNLLSRIDKEDPLKFSGEQLEKDMIKGEALALRAFLHFDMLRLFAPYKDNGKTYVPYFEKYPSTFEPRETVNNVMEKVIRDLELAKDLVAPYDTVDDRAVRMGPRYRFTMGSGGSASLGVTDLFEAYRGYRMNYYAINAVLARAYAYVGKYQEAFDITSMLIDAQDSDDDNLFEFTPDEDVIQKPKLYDDLIFALSNQKLLENYELYYNTEEYKLYLDIYDKEDMFDDAADYRGTKLVSEVNSWYYLSLKYAKSSSPSTESSACEIMIPIIRLSEMYYIRAEYYAQLGRFQEATTELDNVRRGRNCTIGRLNINSLASFQTELLNEAKREFVGEGQLWFYYKKLDVKPTSDMPDGAFILPLPESEIIN